MKRVEPKVWLVGRTQLVWDGLEGYLRAVGADAWVERALADNDAVPDGELLVEAAGRLCYRSWEPGLNKNVTKVRTDRAAYLDNLLAAKHGSVTEHVSFSFIFQNVSRVFTAELNRHRVGTATSQESLRYVRIDELRMWLPPQLSVDRVSESDSQLRHLLLHIEEWLVEYGKVLDALPFERKKSLTSALRRLVPMGMATDVLWTANVRTLRHVLEVRTDPGAEAEMRLVFDQVGTICQRQAPSLFADFTRRDDGAWAPKYSKV